MIYGRNDVIQNNQNVGYLVNIIFMFDRCHRSSTVLTPENTNVTNFYIRKKIVPDGEISTELYHPNSRGPLYQHGLTLIPA